MIHPSQSELEKYSGYKLTDPAAAEIARHLAVCEFCNDYVRDYQSYQRGLQGILEAQNSGQTVVAPGIFSPGIGRSSIIELTLLPTMRPVMESHLAADGRQATPHDMISLATLFSESPEIVMKLMRDQRDGTNFLQLIAESHELTANVLVSVMGQDIAIVTDEGGRALLPIDFTTDPGSMRWQIHLPEATFDLQPLVYNPDKTEYINESILESERGDRVRITLVGKTVGKQVEIELLALDGKSDFSTAKIVVVVDDKSQLSDVSARQRVKFALPDDTRALTLRIFQ